MANLILFGGGGVSAKPRKLLSSLANGSIVSALEDGKLTQFLISHNYEPDLNGAGRTLFARKEGYDLRQWNNSANSALATSTIDAWLNGDYKAKLSAIVQAGTAATTFEYSVGAGNATVTTLSRAVFLLSATEIGAPKDTYSNIEGEKLPIAGLLNIATVNGTAVTQWTRSAYVNSASQKGAAWVFTANGTPNAFTCTESYYSRPCFTLPSDMALRPEPLPDGSWVLADEEILLDTETAKTTPKSGVSYTNGIADLDAATLHEIGKAISSNPKITNETSVVYYDSGDVHRKISVGDTYNTTYVESGKTTTVPVNIIGFNHDDLVIGTAYETPTATGKAGLSFQTVDSFVKQPMNSSSTNLGGWGSSWLRATYLAAVFNGFSEKTVIKAVKKLTSAGNKSATINTTDDTLFLLSEVEVFGSVVYSVVGEGEQYAYYKAGNSKIKKVSGSADAWWERSPRSNETAYFCDVGYNGTASTVSASGNYGVAFAYCI